MSGSLYPQHLDPDEDGLQARTVLTLDGQLEEVTAEEWSKNVAGDG